MKKPGRAARASLVRAGEDYWFCACRMSVRRTNGGAPIAPLRSIGGHLQELLAIALGDEVFGRDLEVLRQRNRDRFGAPIREDQVVVVRADGVSMALDEVDLVMGSRPITSSSAWPSSNSAGI